jgi:simple sugar transport system ATP-binding protein
VTILDRVHTAPGRVRIPDSVAWIPEDRRGEGIALEMTVAENMRLGLPRSSRPTQEEVLRCLRDFDVRPPDPQVVAARLSGGNQQRLLLARELARKSRLLLAVHPTRGLDPGATAFVRAKLLEARTAGMGILLVTGDRDELQELSDRLLILFRGRIAYAAPREAVDARRMEEAMVGLGG